MIPIGDAAAFVVAKLQRLQVQRYPKTLLEFEMASREATVLALRGEVDRQEAADRLWSIAEAYDLVEQHGPDEVQASLAKGGRHGEIAYRIEFDKKVADADAKNAANLGLQIVPASQVKPTSVEWLWPERLAIGKLHLLAGEGGLGKSTVLLDSAARVTRGADWPDGARGSVPQSVIIMSSEDDLSDTIRPRLQAADADLDKIFFATMVHELGGAKRQFNLQADIERLEERIRQIGDVGLVVIDPLTAYMGKADSNSNDNIRAVLTPLADMAARTRTAVWGNSHMSKSESKSANSRILGARAFVNVVRMAFIVTSDANDTLRRFFIPSKPNITAPQPGLAFRIEQTLVEDERGAKTIVATRICWEPETVMISADDAMNAHGKSDDGEAKTAKAEAVEFLKEVLADGPKPVAEATEAGQAQGFSPKALRIAREALGIKAKKINQVWTWALPS
jgi:putative DNA primase/helicase